MAGYLRSLKCHRARGCKHPPRPRNSQITIKYIFVAERLTSTATVTETVARTLEQTHGQVAQYLALLDQLGLDRNWISGKKKYENYEAILVPKLRLVHKRNGKESDSQNGLFRLQRSEEAPRSKTFPNSAVKHHEGKRLIMLTCVCCIFWLFLVF